MSTDPYQEMEHKAGVPEPLKPFEEPEGTPPLVGSKLRNQRERLGLSLSDVAATTRIQPYILSAMEQEQWERIPVGAYVQGFLRSYARALGLDEEEILNLYRTSAPADEHPLPGIRKQPASHRRLGPLLCLLAALLLAISGYYFWRGGSPPPELLPRGESPLKQEPLPVPEPTAETPRPLEKAAPGKTPLVPHSSQQAEPAAASEAPSSPPPAVQAEGTQTPQPPSPAPQPSAPKAPLSLRAEVRDRTWIKIWVDNQPPKDYIFLPGSRPEWTAREGFELIVGNAGGLALVFNGQRYDQLGDPGKVVRLRFPEEYKRKPEGEKREKRP